MAASALQVFDEKLADLFFHVNPVINLARHVPFIREEQQVIWLVGSDQGIDQAGGVPEMDIFIYQTMHN